MKNNILGIILLALLIVGSSDVMAEPFNAPALVGDYTPEQRQKVEAVQIAYFCSEIYKGYGSTDVYDVSVVEAGIELRKNADILGEHAGIDFMDKANAQITSGMAVMEWREQMPIIPPRIDAICTGVYVGAKEAVERLQAKEVAGL